ncbi:uncharacterized protein B0P05DRAFT_583807 [Gilbertella persicaria]|uniref:uncharacterized protein n=1 Tax=Gilbertella persicaria TaxID=101096 RepID=UPI0022205848|nr:uncharacterized protein B0P05DRAFT_583807 [Gilbertella persicaria]KAI8091291.1 hypothetical protein B0P05DRAFT_583807 [Gilbertella persicaria]
MKSIYFGFILYVCVLVVEAGSYHRRRYIDPKLWLEKRGTEENCSIACTGELANCAERCRRSGVNRDLRTVCQDGVCYCGFETSI